MRSFVTHKLLLALILLVAFALRIVGVGGQSPPGVAHDEVAHWLIARDILAGNHAVYFTAAYGHEAGYHYLEAIFLLLLSDNLLALRLLAAFCGLLGVAVTYALARRLFGETVALLAAGLLAVLFWPVFYGRLALRAISLPVVAGLSAIFWWQAWQSDRMTRWQGDKGQTSQQFTLSPLHLFTVSGLFAGLSLYTYLAARAVPIFFLLFILYLALVHRQELKVRWRGVGAFTAVFLLTAFPLFYYLQTHPGAEFRVAEVSQPLTDLLAGNPLPVLQNGLKLAGMFGVVGDPLWREGVPGAPVFEPVLALLFYGGVFLSLWRWRDGRYAFILLWLLVSLLPSLVTINAPSHIRSINALVVMSIFPALLIHNLGELSTDFPRLSTKGVKLGLTILAFTFFLLYAGRTLYLTFQVWPTGGDIPFAWQTAFAEVAAILDESDGTAVALAGWSPDTMDSPTMTLLRQNDAPPISHFNPQEGTLIIPPTGQIIRPSTLPLDPYWETQLAAWGVLTTTHQHTTHYTLPTAPLPAPQFPANTSFGNELVFLGHDFTCHPVTLSPSDGCHRRHLVTYWRVTAVPAHARRLFIHFLDENGQQIGDAYAFDTADPQSLWFPHWQPGDLILQKQEIPIPLTDVAHIRLGWFDPYSCDPGPCQNLLTPAGAPFLVLPLDLSLINASP
ncbi:MAG: glycosyltransferase family 39 protein [Anaerolineae bacterium]|nr:glycosyltransferase family 39 protein [Anaerolineae bacterium]